MINKRIVIFMTALLFAAGILSAQNSETESAAPKSTARKLAFSLDVVPMIRANLLESEKSGLGGALNAEIFIAKNYSLGLRIEGLTVPDVKTSFIGFDAHARYYFKEVDISGFFLDMGVGWGLKYVNYDGTDELETGGLMYSLKAGYKQFIVSGLFMEPTIAYTLAKPTGGYGPAGFDLGFSVGFAF